MEFNEKLQNLRKSKNLTQEQLAELLFVSRTAISKWESGRGYPSIESLKMISKFFSVSIDELLSCEEVITLAQNDTKEKTDRICNLVFGIIDVMTILLMIFPMFGQQDTDMIRSVSLLELTEISGWLKIIYFVIIGLISAFGAAELTLQNIKAEIWLKYKNAVSLFLTSLGVMMFMISQQPYAGAFLFCMLTAKGILRLKRQ